MENGPRRAIRCNGGERDGRFGGDGGEFVFFPLFFFEDIAQKRASEQDGTTLA